MVGRAAEEISQRGFDNRRSHGYEESIGRTPRELVVGGYNDLEQGRLHDFLRWWDRLRPPWGVVLFAALAAGLFLLGILGAAIVVWSAGGIIGSLIGIVLVAISVSMASHLGSPPGSKSGVSPRGVVNK